MNIPYVKQITNLSCGPACLEMVYKYYGIGNIAQVDILKKYKVPDPHNPSGIRVLTNDLVLDARSNGLSSSIVVADVRDMTSAINLLKIFTDSGIPVIVCQQYSPEFPLTGHFRVVYKIDGNNVYLHDPDTDIEGGESLKWSCEKFFQLWQPTGENVTGGRFVWIKK